MEPPYARLEGRNFDFLMHKRRIVIGRNSKMGSVDVNMGNSRFISRKHIDILMDKGVFYLICRGKNGIFVNDHFQKREAAKFPLPSSCILRFPSTQIKIAFTTQTEPHALPNSSGVLSHADATQLSRLDPSSSPFVSPFVSPCPSPTGTISAINSAPGSPRGGGPTRARLPSFEMISQYASELLAAHKEREGEGQAETGEEPDEEAEMEEGESATPAGSPSKGEGSSEDKTEESAQKPPYSYAQLIVQGLLAAKDHKQTLSGIYEFISSHYPYYKMSDKGWKNSIRHNLSLNQYFMKAPRQPMSGKGGYWCMHADFEDKLVAQAYTKRRKKGVPIFPTSGLITRSAPASPTHHMYMPPMDFVMPTSIPSGAQPSTRLPSRGFQPRPPPPPAVHSSSSHSLPGSPERKARNYVFKSFLPPMSHGDWTTDGSGSSSEEPPLAKKAKLDNGHSSPEPATGQAAVPTHPSQLPKVPGMVPPAMHPQTSMGLPYVLLPIPFPNQFPPQFMPPATGTGDGPSNQAVEEEEEEGEEEDSEGKSPTPPPQHADEGPEQAED